MPVGKHTPVSIMGSFPLTATKYWLICQATLLLAVNLRVTADTGLSGRHWCSVSGHICKDKKCSTAVDPPDDLMVLDPGFLGYLKISWSPPASLTNATECPKLYQLEYFDAYRGKWNAVRTPMRSYSAQFDLMKDVRVRVYTLLSGPCTGGTMVKSAKYTELVRKPPNTGAANTQVRNFECVNYNMMTVECTWQRGAKTPDNALQHLYFWHKELEHVEECPDYIISRGIRSGCRFTETSLPLFTDINLCVNGSSPEGPLQPQFISLQIQNHVKPPTTEKVHVHASPDKLELSWEHPVGRVPGHCLEWEVEHRLDGPDGNTSELTLTTKTSLTLTSVDRKEKNCFRIRSKLQQYCAEKSFWSDWSHPTCLLEKKEEMPGAEEDTTPDYVYVTVAIIATLVLFLSVGSAAAFKMRKTVPNHAATFS